MTPHSTNIETRLTERLLRQQRVDGGWGYRMDGESCAEPTAWASVALSGGRADERAAALRGLAWLASIQEADGGVPLGADRPGPYWCTAPALLAWSVAGDKQADLHAKERRLALTFVLGVAGEPVPSNPEVFGHDTSLLGWSWVAGTHSWVEPTATAVLALKASGEREHQRTREGVRLLFDRALPGGGWNYGNTRVFGRTLRPFPETTGLVLSALAGEPHGETIELSHQWLRRELERVTAPLSAAWGAIAMARLGRLGPEVDAWVARAATAIEGREPSALHEALLLIASRGVPWETNQAAERRPPRK